MVAGATEIGLAMTGRIRVCGVMLIVSFFAPLWSGAEATFACTVSMGLTTGVVFTIVAVVASILLFWLLPVSGASSFTLCTTTAVLRLQVGIITAIAADFLFSLSEFVDSAALFSFWIELAIEELLGSFVFACCCIVAFIVSMTTDAAEGPFGVSGFVCI
jgi:hypothetical protein